MIVGDLQTKPQSTLQIVHKDRVSMHRRRQVWLGLTDVSGVVPSWFPLSLPHDFYRTIRYTNEYSLRPLFKVIVYARSWVRKPVNS